MICQQLPSLLGLACHPLDEAGNLALIETPFRFADGAPMRVFAEHVGKRLRFFDDGTTFIHFRARGLRLETGSHTRFLQASASQYGGSFNDDGEIEVWAEGDDTPTAFARYIGVMLSLLQWEREHTSVSHDAEQFVEEVAMCLIAWKGAEHVKRKPRVSGLTGRSYDFDFDLDGTLVLAISAHPNSASSALHKLVDVRGLPANMGREALVVIDDRTEPEAARAETMVLSAVGPVMGMVQLQKHAGLHERVH